MQKHISFLYVIGAILVAGSVYAIIYTAGYIKNQPLIGDQEYNIFRDLLTVVLTIISVVIAGVTFMIYAVLSNKFKQETEDTARKTIKKEIVELYIEMGYVYWRDFKIAKEEGTDIKIYEEYLKEAIRMTETALDMLSKLKTDNDELKCVIYNNYSYYIAAKSEKTIDDKNHAIKMAKHIYDKISEYPKRKKDFSDTHAYVQKQCGSS